ncbi:folate-binding protein YgfZ [Propioniciclava coleopterorum]|uniref:Folate-binding protein YgfZ n=1 Tax=Propioniciclava coleopterorum TaxID=2714937 RepID=A0A6G7Y4J2_9ACTN|nr:folate-binding protein YgfZ [Propioniciclava coleopterorum]QIK71740.1 folate-binding protein YgfZ [Propioniciclava coleopterorum]
MSAVRHTEGPDAGAVWHYGDPLGEQRRLEAGRARVDASHRPIFTVSGADRLTWLHAVTSQAFEGLAPGVRVTAFVLDPQGHVEHVFGGVDDGDTFWADTEPGRLEPLLGYLQRMVFASRVTVADASADWALLLDAAAPRRVPRADLEAELGDERAGTWASEAVRIAAGQPRIFLDTDEKTIPNELANPDGDLLGPAVHLQKGCYRGQETVARVHTLGRPPRRLTLLHLDGSEERLPEVGDDVLAGDRVVGRMGTSAVHHDLGPIGLALIKRNTPLDAPLTVAGIAAAQEVLVDPEVGLHVRPKLR